MRVGQHHLLCQTVIGAVAVDVASESFNTEPRSHGHSEIGVILFCDRLVETHRVLFRVLVYESQNRKILELTIRIDKVISASRHKLERFHCRRIKKSRRNHVIRKRRNLCRRQLCELISVHQSNSLKDLSVVESDAWKT